MTLNVATQNLATQISSVLTPALDKSQQAAQWLGRQIVVLSKAVLSGLVRMGTALSHIAKNVISLASPYFSSFQSYLLANKEIAIAATAGAAIGITGYVVASKVLCSERGNRAI